VNRRVLAEAGESIGWFLNSGPTGMGDKLGPLLWQFAATKQFDPEDFCAFLKLLPKEHAGVRLRHVVEPRHPSFQTEAFVDLVREAQVAVVYADSDDYPGIADLSADFVYARLQRSGEDVETGYADAELDAWAARAKRWAEGGEPSDLPHFGRDTAPERPRDVFVYFIAGAKVRDPAAAQALIARL
jgi:uncharacterized protein YecE (DUF72 family)